MVTGRRLATWTAHCTGLLTPGIRPAILTTCTGSAAVQNCPIWAPPPGSCRAALSISQRVIAVTVVAADPDHSAGHTHALRGQWARWNPGVPLRELNTQYASIAGPFVAFIDRLRRHHD